MAPDPAHSKDVYSASCCPQNTEPALLFVRGPRGKKIFVSIHQAMFLGGGQALHPRERHLMSVFLSLSLNFPPLFLLNLTELKKKKKKRTGLFLKKRNYANMFKCMNFQANIHESPEGNVH